jgi:hypothetical protein
LAEGLWSRFSRLRVRAGGGVLWTWWWTYGFWRHGVSIVILRLLLIFGFVSWEVREMIDTMPRRSHLGAQRGCICHGLAWRAAVLCSRNTLRNSEPFFGGGFMSVLLEMRQVVQCTAVRSMKRGSLWGEQRGGTSTLAASNMHPPPIIWGNFPPEKPTD